MAEEKVVETKEEVKKPAKKAKEEVAEVSNAKQSGVKVSGPK